MCPNRRFVTPTDVSEARWKSSDLGSYSVRPLA